MLLKALGFACALLYTGPNILLNHTAADHKMYTGCSIVVNMERFPESSPQFSPNFYRGVKKCDFWTYCSMTLEAPSFENAVRYLNCRSITGHAHFKTPMLVCGDPIKTDENLCT